MIFPRKPEKRIPRKTLSYTTNRQSAPRCIFYWWRHPVARLYVIAGQMAILQNNPDVAAHAQFFGEKEGSIAYEYIRLMQVRDPDLYECILQTCRDEKLVGMAGVVHKFYERIQKVGVEPELGQAGKNEHYLKRHNPATEAEIESARKMVMML